MADYPKLKVPELKEILTARGLSIKGVKAELIARLEDDDVSSASKGGDEATQEKGEEDEEVVDIPSSEATKVELHTDGLNNYDSHTAAPEAKSAHPIETLQVQEEPKLRGQEDQVEEAVAEKYSKEEAPSLSNRLGAKQDKEVAKEPSMPSAIGPAHLAGRESIVPEHTLASTPAAPSSVAAETPPKAQEAVLLSSLFPPHPPTRAVRVTGLVRPMMLPSLKETLQDKFGQLDDGEIVKGGVWLDGIKSCGWIVFKEVAAAEELVQTFGNKPFPSSDSFRTPVSFFYVPPEVVPRLVEEEERCWEKERGRLDIVVSTSQSDEGSREGVYEYSTRPLQQQKKIRDLKPPPASATAAHSSGAIGGQGLSIRGSGFNKRPGLPISSNGSAELPVDGSSLPPVSFPPVRSPTVERKRDEGRPKGGRVDGRYHPYPPPPREHERHAVPSSAGDFPKSSSASDFAPAAPVRDAQTELELSRSRDAAASAYAGRGGRPPPSGPPSVPYDSRRDDFGGGRGSYERGGRGYDHGGAGYAYRGGYDRYDERDRDRRRGYEHRAPSVRDDRSFQDHRTNGARNGSGPYGDRVTSRGASPGWRGDHPPVALSSAPVRFGEDRYGSHHGRERDWDRPDRAPSYGAGRST